MFCPSFSCSSRPTARIFGVIGVVASSALLMGCGGSDFSTADVSGTVTLNGQPVTGGTIMLTPIATGDSKLPGKGAAGRVQKDGSFVLTTYEEGDGAIIGKHSLSYIPPTATEGAANAKPGTVFKSPYSGVKPKKPEVEITSGDNTLTVELVK